MSSCCTLSYVDSESVKLISVFEGKSAMSSVMYERFTNQDRFKSDALVIVPGSMSGHDSADTSTGSPLDLSVGTGAGSTSGHDSADTSTGSPLDSSVGTGAGSTSVHDSADTSTGSPLD